MNYDRIILELLDRMSALEEEVKQLKQKGSAADELVRGSTDDMFYNGKDTTKYMMDGKRYGKNRLALAVVQKYMMDHPDTSASELMRVFDKSLQGSLGVVRALKDAKRSYLDSEKRFFMQSHEVIHTSTEDCVVCTQWGAFNIEFLIERAKELGFVIRKI